MRFSQSETMGSSGILRNIFIWLWERVVPIIFLQVQTKGKWVGGGEWDHALTHTASDIQVRLQGCRPLAADSELQVTEAGQFDSERVTVGSGMDKPASEYWTQLKREKSIQLDRVEQSKLTRYHRGSSAADAAAIQVQVHSESTATVASERRPRPVRQSA